MSTVALLSRTGELEVDLETDTSGARFVTRASVERWWMTRQKKPPQKHAAPIGIPVDEVARFTGYTPTELIDLVRTGLLEQFPGQRKALLSAQSVQAWLDSQPST